MDKSDALKCMELINQTLLAIGMCFEKEEAKEMEHRIVMLSAAISIYYRVPPLFILFPYNKVSSYKLKKPSLAMIYDARELVYEMCEKWYRKKDIMLFVRAISDIFDLWS